MSILEKGLSFNHSNPCSITDEVIQLETKLRQFSLDMDSRKIVSSQALNALKALARKHGKVSFIPDFSTPFPKHALKACKRELREKEVVVLKADKGGHTILNRKTNIQKGVEALDSPDIILIVFLNRL